MRLLALATVFLATSPLLRAQDAASTPFRNRSTLPSESTTPKPRVIPTPEPVETFTLQPMTTPMLEPIPTPTLEPIVSPLPRPTLALPTPKPLASPPPRSIATPTPRPSATPKPKPTATPTPRPIATPSPRPTPTPKPIATPAPAPTESPAADQGHEDIAATLKALEARWEASYMTHDISVMEQLVADDFVGTSSSGKVGNKTTMIAEARKDKNVYTSAVSSDMAVQTFGPNIAVVTGIARETGKTPSGKAFSHAYRFTDTWMERNGVWQCVAASAMALPKK